MAISSSKICEPSLAVIMGIWANSGPKSLRSFMRTRISPDGVLIAPPGSSIEALLMRWATSSRVSEYERRVFWGISTSIS